MFPLLWGGFSSSKGRLMRGKKPGSSSCPHSRPRLAGRDGASPGSAVQPEVYTKLSWWISFIPGGYVSQPRSVTDPGTEGRVDRRSNNNGRAGA